MHVPGEGLQLCSLFSVPDLTPK